MQLQVKMQHHKLAYEHSKCQSAKKLCLCGHSCPINIYTSLFQFIIIIIKIFSSASVTT